MDEVEVEYEASQARLAKHLARAAKREAADSDHWEWLSRERSRLIRRYIRERRDHPGFWAETRAAAIYRIGQCRMVLR